MTDQKCKLTGLKFFQPPWGGGWWVAVLMERPGGGSPDVAPFGPYPTFDDAVTEALPFLRVIPGLTRRRKGEG